MFRLLFSGFSTLSMLASALLLWQSDFFPEKLPNSLALWALAFFSLFQDPFVAMTLYGFTACVVLGSWFITELLLGFLYAILAALLAFGCLIGFLSVHYPPIQQYFQAMAQ
jgi:ABC-type polysaccharide/polyol phosphate export permease